MYDTAATAPSVTPCEGEEAGVNQQVRNGIDGLVSLDEANIGGTVQLTMTSAPEAMNTTLGSSNVYGATEGWNVQ